MRDWPPEKKSQVMKTRALERWACVTKEERTKIALKMVEARRNKRNAKA